MNKLLKTYERGEIVKIPFPFIDKEREKLRPALILSSREFNSEREMSIMAMITSVKEDRPPWNSDILIEDLDLAGLPIPSLIRFKLFTLDHRLILGRLGKLGEREEKKIAVKLRELFF